MKNIKWTGIKVILIHLALILITCNLFPQKGFQLGYVNYDSNPKSNVLIANGIQGGLTYDIKLRHLIYLHTAALLSVTYYKYNYRFSDGDYKLYDVNNFISIPLQFKFILPQTSGFDVFVYTGPTLRGRFYGFGRYENLATNEKYSYSYFSSPLKYGLTLFYGAGIGFKYKNGYIKGNYDWGILSPTDNIKMNSFSIAIGKIL